MTRPKLKLFRLWVVAACVLALAARAEAVVPVLVGPFQAFLALLPSILAALGALCLAVFKPSTVKKLVLFLWHQKVFSLCLIVLTAGVVYGFQNDWWRSRGEVSEAEAGMDWPAFRGGPERRGLVPGWDDPTVPYAQWNYLYEKTFYCTPTVVGNRIYATYVDFGPYTDKGAILCIDAETGGEVWRYDAGGYRATFSSPSVKDGYIVCGEGLHKTADARIVCLNMDGEEQWTHRTSSHVESTPCIANGRAYIGAGDDGYYCIKLEPDENGEAQIEWHLAGDNYRDCETSPIVHDGVVYFGLGVGGKAIVAVDAESGEERWRMETDYPVFAPPSVSDGKLYVGMGNGDFVFSAEEVKANLAKKMADAEYSEAEIRDATKTIKPAGEVWCIDLETQKVDWKFGSGPKDKLKRNVLGAIAVGQDCLYFGSRDKYLYCISKSGTLLARWNAHSPLLTSPALANEHVYVVTGSGVLHCLTADGLEQVWEMGLGGGDMFISSPTVARGHVYVGTPLDGLRCLGRAGARPPVVWTHGERGRQVDRSPVPATAQRTWYYPQDRRAKKKMKFRVTAPLMSLGEFVYAPCERYGKPELVKFKVKYQKEHGRHKKALTDDDRFVWAASFDAPIRTAPVGIGNTIYAATTAPGRPGALHCIDADSGQDRWSIRLEPGASGELTLDREHLLAWTGPGTITCYPVGMDGPPAAVWRTLRCGPGSVSPVIAKDIVVVAGDARLTALDKLTGAELWLTPPELGGKPTCAPLVAGRSVIVATEAGLFAYALSNGAEQWSDKRAAVRRPPAPDRERLAIVFANGELALLSVVDGAPVMVRDKEDRTKRIPFAPLPASDQIPPLVLPESIIYIGADLSEGEEEEEEEEEEETEVEWNLTRLARDLDRPPQRWIWSSWQGKILAPPLLLDSKVYFATDTYGLICAGPSKR